MFLATGNIKTKIGNMLKVNKFYRIIPCGLGMVDRVFTGAAFNFFFFLLQ